MSSATKVCTNPRFRSGVHDVLAAKESVKAIRQLPDIIWHDYNAEHQLPLPCSGISTTLQCCCYNFSVLRKPSLYRSPTAIRDQGPHQVRFPWQGMSAWSQATVETAQWARLFRVTHWSRGQWEKPPCHGCCRPTGPGGRLVRAWLLPPRRTPCWAPG